MFSNLYTCQQIRIKKQKDNQQNENNTATHITYKNIFLNAKRTCINKGEKAKNE